MEAVSESVFLPLEGVEQSCPFQASSDFTPVRKVNEADDNLDVDPQASEAGSGHLCSFNCSDGSSGETAIITISDRLTKDYELAETMYTLKYVEKNGRAQGNIWSIRQTIVYHKHAVDGNDSWILLHPKEGSVFQKRLATALSDIGRAEEIQSDPAVVHLMLFSSYLENWRWYLAQLSETFLNSVRSR